ncbi:metal ABC transporter solute-binding protein, Zn/Mn family [Tautonia sociabilis]|uniref:Manganese transporter n=1 Tax=Tautonia sociabilis TaxID=2080755 RepID=A0A432MCH2_9BACT|nr:zinc ABC transporter substrate-binding protein [Tautonia sociabilis]RUL81753.1 manganese transporter [Tautonia sociabilis]
MACGAVRRGRRARIAGGAARVVLLAMVATASGCGGGGDQTGLRVGTYTGNGPIEVVCTTGMVGEVVARVGGDRVRVSTLMGAGVDPHLYKPSPGDISTLSRADAVFSSGLHLEGKMGEVLERMGRSKPSVAVAEAIEPTRLIDTSGGQVDPHVWFDVALWAEVVAAAREALSIFDPGHADAYMENADRYRAELLALDAEVRERIAEIPEDRRVLVTAHDAFGYFGRAYGIEVRGIQGISTESEAGVREVNELVDLLVDRRIPAVFVESSVSDRNVRALVEGCAARGHAIRIGGQLYSDAMGDPGTPEGTYPGMVRHNVATIVEALK